MRHLPSGLILFLLVLTGCTSQQPSQTASPQGDPDQSASSPPAAAGLPAVTAMKDTGALTPPDDPTSFTFVVFGDNRPASGDPQPETIKEIFKEIDELHPSFAMSLGDVIEGKPKKDDPKAISKIRQQFKDFLALAKTAGVPIFNAPGNHEMDDHEGHPDRAHARTVSRVCRTDVWRIHLRQLAVHRPEYRGRSGDRHAQAAEG